MTLKAPVVRCSDILLKGVELEGARGAVAPLHNSPPSPFHCIYVGTWISTSILAILCAMYSLSYPNPCP